MHTKLSGQARCLTAYVGEQEMYEDRPLWQALMAQARTQGCAGATAISCKGGFGAASRNVAAHDLRMSRDTPMLVRVIDEEVAITALAEVWDAMVDSGLVTIEPIEVVCYR